MTQMVLPMKTLVAKTIDDLEMGVLDDGRSYFTGRTLAELCGVVPSAIIKQAENWKTGNRDGKLARLLIETGIDRDSLYIPTAPPAGQGGTVVHAYTDDIAMLFLEYYAFDDGRKQAQENLRRLNRAGMRIFIYNALGFVPNAAVPEVWAKYQDRMTLNRVPVGYFNVFREMGEFMVSAMREGFIINEHSVPDISIGRSWSKAWEGDIKERHGLRHPYPHVYPAYFPQAQAGEVDAWIYPVSALGEFRTWMHNVYIPDKFPEYLKRKVKDGLLTASTVQLILKAVEHPRLAEPDLDEED